MKLFGRTGGYWMFWTGAIYLGMGLPVALYYKDVRPELIQLAWIIVLSMPFWWPPLGRWLNMDITWDQKMFNLFGKKDKDNNVVKFPEALKTTVKSPEPPKEEEKPAKIFYRLGLTDNNRVSFQMGYSEITMNAAGCQQMIDQLEFFKSQLYDEDPGGGPDGDGGEPIPVPEQKAA